MAARADSEDYEDEISLGGTPPPDEITSPSAQETIPVAQSTQLADEQRVDAVPEVKDGVIASDNMQRLASSSEPSTPSTQNRREEPQAMTFKGLDQILGKKSAEATLLAESFQNPGAPFYEICQHSTRNKCTLAQPDSQCHMAHFKIRQFPQTEPSLGDCSYLNTCHHLDTCRYLHYELETPSKEQAEQMAQCREQIKASEKKKPKVLPPQWIDCDLRKIDATVLGTFDVIMADPPWDIQYAERHIGFFMHLINDYSYRFSMTLPYGTMTDDEMKAMPLAQLQKDGGLLFLWVTGRATELGRECLKVWGYQAIDEIVWIKTNQLGRLIRTGRTGHWLNHSKEHCIVAYKRPASPSATPTCIDRSLEWANRGIDTDVIVAEVRETSRKPEEIYSIIERITAPKPDTLEEKKLVNEKPPRRLELFGRKHNVRPGWITLGNQLGDSCIYEKDVVDALNKRYPDAPPLDVQSLPKDYWDKQGAQ